VLLELAVPVNAAVADAGQTPAGRDPDSLDRIDLVIFGKRCDRHE